MGLRKQPRIVLENGLPSAVILNIDDYIEMLERLDDLEDLEMLREMREGPLEFRSLESFLQEQSQSV